MSTFLFPERRGPPSRETHIHFIRESVKIAHRALGNGRHPFGCILVSEDNEILFTQGNIDTLNHAEATLCRTAWTNLSPSDLWKCTLYTNFEPCAMCAGSIYWANIGSVVYGCTEERLLALTGDDSENMTLNLSCRELFKSGQKDVRVFGPFEEVENDVGTKVSLTDCRLWPIILRSGKEILGR
jgi:tRNA(Arg) A34 adenosine deaminase TadA